MSRYLVRGSGCKYVYFQTATATTTKPGNKESLWPEVTRPHHVLLEPQQLSQAFGPFYAKMGYYSSMHSTISDIQIAIILS